MRETGFYLVAGNVPRFHVKLEYCWFLALNVVMEENRLKTRIYEPLVIQVRAVCSALQQALQVFAM